MPAKNLVSGPALLSGFRVRLSHISSAWRNNYSRKRPVQAVRTIKHQLTAPVTMSARHVVITTLHSADNAQEQLLKRHARQAPPQKRLDQAI